MTDKSLAQIISETTSHLRSSVPDCVAAGVIDLSTGMLLAVETTDTHPREVLDLLAAATFDLFQGRNVAAIEDIFRRRRQATGSGHYFQEILINSQHLSHLFMRSTVNPNIVVTVVCRLSANVGMVLAQSRLIMRQMAAAGV